MWLSSSFSGISRSRPGDAIPLADPTTASGGGWGSVRVSNAEGDRQHHGNTHSQPSIHPNFASDLRAFSEETHSGIVALTVQLDDLGATDWHDHTQREYKRVLEPGGRLDHGRHQAFRRRTDRRLELLAQQAEQVRY